MICFSLSFLFLSSLHWTSNKRTSILETAFFSTQFLPGFTLLPVSNESCFVHNFMLTFRQSVFISQWTNLILTKPFFSHRMVYILLNSS